jgi:hypothetical protein
MNVFIEGSCYTRKQISRRLGGGTQDFLPHSRKHVVCGCFKRKFNPNAPKEILPGKTDNKQRWAQQFYEQGEAVPIFVKQTRNHWEYVGLWRCLNLDSDIKRVKAANRRAGRTDVAMILTLEKTR